MLSGRVSADDYETAPRRHFGAEWLPPRWAQVDPLKDTQALVAQFDARLTSRRRAVAEMGLNFEELAAELAEEGEPDAAQKS